MDFNVTGRYCHNIAFTIFGDSLILSLLHLYSQMQRIPSYRQKKGWKKNVNAGRNIERSHSLVSVTHLFQE